MLAARRDTPPPLAECDVWAALTERFDHIGEPLFMGWMLWVPQALVEEYRTLVAIPLPSSADAEAVR